MSHSPLSQSTNAARRIGQFLRRGDQFIWLSGGAMGLAALLIVGLLGLVFVSGFTFFWPYNVVTADRADGTPVLGVITNSQEERLDPAGNVMKAAQTQFKVGAREL